MGLDLAHTKQVAATQDGKSWVMLNDIFRRASSPEPPLGRYQGALLALRIAPGVTNVMEALTDRWLPWLGKEFDDQSGVNIFRRDSLRIARVVWPRYSGYQRDTESTYRAFQFRTRMDRGLLDPDRDVLVLDYYLPGNPPINVKRVRDELVQLEDRSYLGKAHFHWYWGTWQTVAFFSLTQA